MPVLEYMHYKYWLVQEAAKFTETINKIAIPVVVMFKQGAYAVAKLME